MEHKIEENLIQDIQNPEKKLNGIGFEMSPEQAGEITAELSKLNEAILHDKPISIDDLEDLSKVAKGTKIDVGGEIMTLEEAENDPDLKMNIEIWKEMREGEFYNTEKITRITPSVSKYLENVKGDINLNGLTSAKGLILPNTVKSLSLDSLTSAEGLTLPTTINGYLDLNGLTSAEGLTLPATIKGSLSLDSLTSAKGLILPTIISEGFLSLDSLTSAKGLILPVTVEGDFFLSRLTSTEGLTLPTTVNGNLFLDSLTSAKGLTLPTIVKESLYLRSLPSADKEELRKKYPQHAGKI